MIRIPNNHFIDYINAHKHKNLHPKLSKLYTKFPPTINNMKNMIFYGPAGVGKYTQTLASILKYSSYGLNYEKKLCITYNKSNYVIKISDVHYEVDMSLLGCQSKIMWHEIYTHIIDIISAKTVKSGIIVCKYFHNINSELLENFYGYMQNVIFPSVNVKFILITESTGFIPQNILECCYMVRVPRPTLLKYNSILNEKINANPNNANANPNNANANPNNANANPNNANANPNNANANNANANNANMRLSNITNIKYIGSLSNQLHNDNKISDNIVALLLDKNINLNELREKIYDIFIYNIDPYTCLWNILSHLFSHNLIPNINGNSAMPEIVIKIIGFSKYFNNNYRPIYHYENILLFLYTVIWANPTSRN